MGILRFRKDASTLIEAMVVLVIVTIGVTGTYQVLEGGNRLAETTEARIQAINLAREGIEAVENIRNTNWVKFSSDYENCFDVLNYDGTCVGNASTAKMSDGVPRILVNQDGMWYLSGSSTTWSGVTIASNGVSVQGAGSTLAYCNSKAPRNCRTPFFRTVTITNVGASGSKKFQVTSTVSWRDDSKNTPYRIQLTHILTNWKPNF